MDERDVTTADAEPAEETPLVVPPDDGGAAEEGAQERVDEPEPDEDEAPAEEPEVAPVSP